MRYLLPFFLVVAQAGLILAQNTAVGGPTQTQDPNYPLRVLILGRNTQRLSYGVNVPYYFHVWGRCDIFIGPQEQGFDYDCKCEQLFMVSFGDERYSARWKKSNEELGMLVSQIGTGKSNKCVLKTDLKPYIYEYDPGSNGRVITKPLTSMSPAASATPAAAPPASPGQ